MSSQTTYRLLSLNFLSQITLEPEIGISSLSFNKSSEDSTFNKYNINVDLEEQSSDNTKTTVKYAFDLTSEPKNSVISITGNAMLKGQPIEVEKYLKQEDGQVPPIVANIYKELFPLMYVVSKDMKMPAPAHNLTQGSVSDTPLKQTDETEEVIDKQEKSNEIIEESNETTNEDKTEIKSEQSNTDQ